MKIATATLELEDDKFKEMEMVLLKNGYKSLKSKMLESDWIQFVIEEYNATEIYLDCNNGNLEQAYEDAKYDI